MVEHMDDMLGGGEDPEETTQPEIIMMTKLGPETLEGLADETAETWSNKDPLVVEMRLHVAAWEAERADAASFTELLADDRELIGKLGKANEALEERIRVLKSYIAILGAGTERHHPDCPQFTGPYDLGELEPACTCGYDALMAGA